MGLIIQRGTAGAIANPIEIELADPQYGIVADGNINPITGVVSGTDNTTAMQAVLDSVPINAVVGGPGGAIIKFPGLVRCRSPLTTVRPFTTLRGGSNNFAHITAYIPGSGLIFDPVSGTGDALTFTSGGGLQAQGGSLENMVIATNTSGAAVWSDVGMDMTRVKLHSIPGCLATALPDAGYGTGLHNALGAFSQYHCYIGGYGTGVNAPNSHGFLMHHTSVIGNYLGAKIGGGMSGCDGAINGRSVFQDNVLGDIDLLDPAGVQITGNYFEWGNGDHPSDPDFGHSFLLRLGSGSSAYMSYNIAFRDNYCIGQADRLADMIIIDRVKVLKIVNNVVLSAYGTVFKNNKLGVSGIWIDGTNFLDLGGQVINDYAGVVYEDLDGYPNFRTGFSTHLNSTRLRVT